LAPAPLSCCFALSPRSIFGGGFLVYHVMPSLSSALCLPISVGSRSAGSYHLLSLSALPSESATGIIIYHVPVKLSRVLCLPISAALSFLPVPYKPLILQVYQEFRRQLLYIITAFYLCQHFMLTCTFHANTATFSGHSYDIFTY